MMTAGFQVRLSSSRVKARDNAGGSGRSPVQGIPRRLVTEEATPPGTMLRPCGFLARRSSGQARRGSMQAACDRGSNAVHAGASSENLAARGRHLFQFVQRTRPVTLE